MEGAKKIDAEAVSLKQTFPALTRKLLQKSKHPLEIISAQRGTVFVKPVFIFFPPEIWGG